jgi:excisionase family DNA binding protein
MQRNEPQVEPPVQDAHREVHPAELLTTREVQEQLHVDATTIYRMAADGRLPAVKVGRQWRFPADAVAALLSAGQPHRRQGAALDLTPVQAVLDVAAPLLGVVMVATDMAGRPISDVANPCPWFDERAEDEQTLQACTQEWQQMAADVDFSPHFRQGQLGFECARVFIRSGSELVGMVLAGGVAPEGDTGAGLHHLDTEQRTAVLDALPRVSAALSRAASQPHSPTTSRTRVPASSAQ